MTIKYNDSKTLKVLKALSEYLGFNISEVSDNRKKKEPRISKVVIIPGDPTIDTSEMSEIIGRNKIDAKKLRQSWQRNK